MGDDLLGDILRATTGEAPAAPGRIGDVIGQAVSRPARPAAAVAPPDLAPLAALDEAGAKAFLRYLPADLMVPLLAHAPVAVAQRLVGAMDADARAWLQSQNDEIEAATPERHLAAAVKAMAVLQKLREEGRVVPVAPAVAPAPPVRPVQVALSFGVEPASDRQPAASDRQPAASDRQPAASDPTPADPTAALLRELVAAARGRRPGELRQLAAGLDHPVLAQGLRLVADGADPHDLDAQLRSLAADHLAAEEQRLQLIRQALLDIRLG